MPTTPQALINEAKRLQRLQARRRKQRKDLRITEGEIKLVKKNIRALSYDSALDPDDQLPPRLKGKME